MILALSHPAPLSGSNIKGMLIFESVIREIEGKVGQ